VKVGLFTYHDDSSTAAYLRTAIGVHGDTVVPLGLHWPQRGLPIQGHGLENATADLDALLFVDPPGPFWPVGLDEVGCPTAAYLIDTHQDLGLRLAYAPFFDEIFVAQKDDVGAVRDSGYRQAEWLPLAAAPAFARDPMGPRPLDVAFVGQTGQPGTLRRGVLDAVTSTFETNDVGRRYTPAEMCDLYGQAKVVINASIGGDVNMRVFEAMVSGALLVTDRVANGLDQLFVEGEHYAGYSSASEAQAVIARYLDDDGSRARIAAAAQQHVLAHHTYLHRWITVRNRLTAPDRAVRALASAPPATRRRAYARVCAWLGQPALVWRSTRPWVPRLDSPSNLGYTAVALGRMTNRVVPFTPRAVRARIRHWRQP
jgi:Glycosyl transferases group 1